MYLKYQVVYEKTESGEIGKEAIHREIAEEINLLIKNKRLHYLTNDPIFDYDIYFAKLKKNEIPK